MHQNKQRDHQSSKPLRPTSPTSKQSTYQAMYATSPHTKSKRSPLVSDLYFNDTSITARRLSNVVPPRETLQQAYRPSRLDQLARLLNKKTRSAQSAQAKRMELRGEIEKTRKHLQQLEINKVPQKIPTSSGRTIQRRQSAFAGFSDLITPTKSKEKDVNDVKMTHVPSRSETAQISSGRPIRPYHQHHTPIIPLHNAIKTTKLPPQARLHPAIVRQFAKLWKVLDEDADGILQHDQLKTIVACAGIPPTDALLADIEDIAAKGYHRFGVDFDTFLDCIEMYWHLNPFNADDLTILNEHISNTTSIGSSDPGFLTIHRLKHLLINCHTLDNTQLYPEECKNCLIESGLSKQNIWPCEQVLDHLSGGISILNT